MYKPSSVWIMMNMFSFLVAANYTGRFLFGSGSVGLRVCNAVAFGVALGATVREVRKIHGLDGADGEGRGGPPESGPG